MDLHSKTMEIISQDHTETGNSNEEYLYRGIDEKDLGNVKNLLEMMRKDVIGSINSSEMSEEVTNAVPTPFGIRPFVYAGKQLFSLSASLSFYWFAFTFSHHNFYFLQFKLMKEKAKLFNQPTETIFI